MSAFASIDPLEGLGPVVRLRIAGEIDMDNADEVASSIVDHVPGDAAGLAIDLGGLTYVDSAGIRVFVELSDRLARNRQRLALAVPAAAPISRVLALVKLELVVPLRDDMESAVAAIDDPHGPL